jgi:isoquinoline 1-oxidoreductase subunit beta
MIRRKLERRDFLKLSVAASGGLLVGFQLPGISVVASAQSSTAPGASANTFMPNAFVRIGTDERVTVIVNHSEMGQGVYTSLPMLLADELDADWTKVGFEPAPVDPKYNHPAFGIQMTGGSSSVYSGLQQFREAGATARAMLIAAAAQHWNVDASTCLTESGAVFNKKNQKLTYGQLAVAAAKLTPPEHVQLKDPKNFTLIGKPIKRLDTPEKLNGGAVFGIDVKLPGMLTAVIARPPIFGAKMKSFDDARARSMPGVRKIVAIPAGVAVIADTFWQAKTARDALRVEWDEGSMQNFSTSEMMHQFRERAKSAGSNVRKDGDAATASVAKKIEAVYEVPYLSHLMMEPLNCAVDLRADSCEVWTGSQFQTIDRANAAKIAGLPPENVQLHTTFLGGGFGRRANPQSDFVVEAVHVAKAAGVPVKVIWTREDDMAGGWYRPAFLHAIEGGVDASGNAVSWRSRLVGQSIMAGTPFAAVMMKGKDYDPASVEGVDDLPYEIPNLTVESHQAEIGVPVQWLRSVGHSHTAFATECFVDELAGLGGKDPYQFRRGLLQKHPRHLGVLDLAAQKAGWGKPLPKGMGRGIAVHFAFESYSAHVAEVSVEDGNVRVHRMVCAIDCGQYVNPGIIAAQTEGGAIFGASAALFQELTFEKGRLQQTNFNSFPVMRMNECPEIQTHIVDNHEKSGGIGEPGVPCAAPAIANAVFAVTGKRIRKLPIRMSEAV